MTIAAPGAGAPARERAATGAVPSWKARSGNATCGKTRMAANKANSKIRIINCQRFMNYNSCSQNYSFPRHLSTG